MGRLIFVLGMGRSGTSALTRVLSLCGASLPERLVAPNHANPTGYWEPQDGLNLNEAFLQRHGSNWYDPRLHRFDEVVDSPDGQEFVDRIAGTLAERLRDPVSIIKEPRITALTAFWFAAAALLEFRVGVVIAVRRPAEVAASLAARDGMPIELSNTLWLKYSLLAEQRSRELPRVVVEYPNLLSDWKREVDRVGRALAVDLSARRDEDVAAFLSPALWRQRAPVDNADSVSPPAIVRAYALLSQAGRDAAFSGSELESLVAGHMGSSEARAAVEQFTQRFEPKSAPQSALVAEDIAS
jgi:hypothetical protein